jgi:hypothetical protein
MQPTHEHSFGPIQHYLKQAQATTDSDIKCIMGACCVGIS